MGLIHSFFFATKTLVQRFNFHNGPGIVCFSYFKAFLPTLAFVASFLALPWEGFARILVYQLTLVVRITCVTHIMVYSEFYTRCARMSQEVRIKG